MGSITAEGATPVAVGDTAPDFTLRWTFDESVSLREWNARTPILLLFYVFDFGRV